ncbi:MAG: Na/Pi cotransporter family protein [Sphaerochaetaceae bacterium]|nr:Na/Pi cotransporter family protein [Sphaerochaetaceae bacterium]
MGPLQIIALLGGAALFLFGMSLMGDGLKKVAGNSLEVILYRLSGTPLKGILLGTGVTAVIQSSSATSVMVVGFVNAGMMKMRQAISIIMGAIIGTSITGWIVALSDIGEGGGFLSLLSTESIAALVAIIGIILRMFSKNRTHNHLGDILLGFAVLMFGMKAMTDAVSGLRSSSLFLDAVTKLSNPFLGIVIGALFTTVIQSASAAVGILQAMSATGAITVAISLPMLMGIGIGAAVPVLLSALGSTANGKRTALSYLMIDVVGAALVSLLFYSANAIVGFGFLEDSLRAVDIALLNTTYRVITILLVSPMTNLMEKLCNLLVKDTPQPQDKELDQIEHLEERLLNYPALAIENVRITINAMAELTGKNIDDAISLYRIGYSEQAFAEVERIESVIDRYEDYIGTYLVKLSAQEMDSSLTRTLGIYLHSLTDFERISDHALNIAERVQEIAQKNITFTSQGKHEMETLLAAISEIVHLIVSCFQNGDITDAYKVEPLEECIDDICDKMKLNHVERLSRGECTLLNGYIFNDLLVDLERISDHCSNTAAVMIEMENGIMGIHGYTNETKSQNTHDFEKHYKEYQQRFHV